MTNVFDENGKLISANISRKSRNGKISYKGKYYPLEVAPGACTAHIVVKKEIYRLYDNGGKTLDRCTCVFMEHEYSRYDPQIREALGFNSEPFHGIGMHCGAIPGRHLGKRIKIDKLPAQARLFVEQVLKGYGYATE